MSYYTQPYGASSPDAAASSSSSAAQNLQFYPSSYAPATSAGGRAGTPSSSAMGYGNYRASSAAGYGYGAGGGSGGGGVGGGAGVAGAVPGVSGRMGEQGGLRTGWLAAFSTEGYEGEPSLLEELDVNFTHVQAKTLAVLNPFGRIDQHLMDDSDLAGPFLFCVLFGAFLFFSGKVDFGYIYGLAALGIPTLHFILGLMSPDSPPGVTSPDPTGASSFPDPTNPNVHAMGGGGDGSDGSHGHLHLQLSSTLTFTRSASVLGYCLLPLVGTSLCGIVMPMDTPAGIVLTSAAIMWCTYSASGIFCAVGRMRGMRGLVAYPLALFYAGFGIMSVFSGRGSGMLAKAG